MKVHFKSTSDGPRSKRVGLTAANLADVEINEPPFAGKELH